MADVDASVYIIVAMIPQFGPMPVAKFTGDPTTDENTAIINAAKLKYGEQNIKISCTHTIVPTLVVQYPSKQLHKITSRVIRGRYNHDERHYAQCKVNPCVYKNCVFENCIFVSKDGGSQSNSYGLKHKFINCEFISQSRVYLFYEDRIIDVPSASIESLNTVSTE